MNANGDAYCLAEGLPVGCSFTAGAPLIRVVHANFVEADTHDWFRVSEVHEEGLVPEVQRA
jgi:hypothetical protein